LKQLRADLQSKEFSGKVTTRYIYLCWRGTWGNSSH